MQFYISCGNGQWGFIGEKHPGVSEQVKNGTLQHSFLWASSEHLHAEASSQDKA